MADIDWNLLARYLAEACTPGEMVEVERWLAESPRHRAILEAARRVATGADRAIASERKAAMLAAVEASGPLRLVSGDTRRVPTFMSPTRLRWMITLGAAAAVLVVALVGGAGRAVLRSGAAAPAAMRVASTVRGQRATFRLPDGTFVMLGAASRLRHPAAFGPGMREVTLEGEAYFDVVHDEHRPFVVRAGDLVAQDLGTSFVVHAYAEDQHAHVVVRSGRVAISSARSASASNPASAPRRVLEPGELGRLAASGEPIGERVDTTAHFAWIGGSLVFHGTPLQDALPQLGRWYDLEFRLADTALGRIPLAGRFREQLTGEGLSLVAATLGVRAVRQGRVVVFYPAAPAR